MENEGLRRSLKLKAGCLNHHHYYRHQGVGTLLKSDYAYISHQYDVWHMTKRTVKQLTQNGKFNLYEQLLP